VYEEAPDAATLLVAGGAGTAGSEDEAEEAAEAALSTVDSEFGRTTDPVRMYMREMGSFELLTREGEIDIAKRIESGLQAAMRASFEKLHKAFDKSGYDSPAYRRAQRALSDEMMTIRFTVKTIDRLCGMLRSQVDDVRRHEREIRRIAVDKCGMPQQRFIE